MNRERAKELLPIIQAFAEGKDIQAKPPGFGWKTPTDPAFFNGDEYRIKPEPRVFWVNPTSNISRAYCLTQEEYESSKWDTSDFIKTIEDLSDD